MNKQEVQECLHSMKLLQEAAQMLQNQFIKENASEGAFNWSCTVRALISTLVFELSRNSHGSDNDADIIRIMASFEQLVSEGWEA